MGVAGCTEELDAEVDGELRSQERCQTRLASR